MHYPLKIKDGFLGEIQINIPREVIIKKLRAQAFLHHLFITQIGFFPKARYHFRERQYGSHDNILLYCVAGKGHYTTLEGKFTLQANEFCILPRGEYHSYQADIRDPWSIYWVHFSGDDLKNFNAWGRLEDFKSPTPIPFDKQIIRLWKEMFAALNNGYTDKNLLLANLTLYNFLGHFLVRERPVLVVEESNPVGDSISFMKANIQEALTVEMLAEQVQFSASHFSALFKAKTGLAPIDYFIRLKIQYACQLLRQTNLKVHEIAAKLGYIDNFYFSRIFKKITGKSPRIYRNSHQTQKIT